MDIPINFYILLSMTMRFGKEQQVVCFLMTTPMVVSTSVVGDDTVNSAAHFLREPGQLMNPFAVPDCGEPSEPTARRILSLVRGE